ncbi:MAG: hypothetical protein HKL80_02595, partial [Acidimicrobiales bacterium]|nr:hypothetical protein [Acidimicrobiales bacterium]
MTPADGTTLIERQREISMSATDHRGYVIPTFGMIAARFKELRKRRGLMITLILGNSSGTLKVALARESRGPRDYPPLGVLFRVKL